MILLGLILHHFYTDAQKLFDTQTDVRFNTKIIFHEPIPTFFVSVNLMLTRNILNKVKNDINVLIKEFGA